MTNVCHRDHIVDQIDRSLKSLFVRTNECDVMHFALHMRAFHQRVAGWLMELIISSRRDCTREVNNASRYT